MRSYFFGADPRAIRRTINKDDRYYTSILVLIQFQRERDVSKKVGDLSKDGRKFGFAVKQSGRSVISINSCFDLVLQLSFELIVAL